MPDGGLRNTVVIMTSNLGSHLFREAEEPKRLRAQIMETLRSRCGRSS